MASSSIGAISYRATQDNSPERGISNVSYPDINIEWRPQVGLPNLTRFSSGELIQDRITETLPKSHYEAMQGFIRQTQHYADNISDSQINCVAMTAALPDIRAHGLNNERLDMRGFLIYEGTQESIEKLAVFTGSLHGDESRIAIQSQCNLLQRLTENNQRMPTNTAILFIPTVNPWGASYGDRCNHNNVDLNRNFPTSESVYDAHPTGQVATAWQEMNTFLHPTKEQSATLFYLRLIITFIKYTLKYLVLGLITQEENPMSVAIAGGQNLDPQKLFYGGTREETNTQAVINMVNQSLALFPNATIVLHNDDHTGLAKKGAHSVEVKASTPVLEETIANAIRETLRESDIPNGYQVECPSARRVFYQIQGDITDWFMQLAERSNIRHVISICQEVGTINHFLGSEPPALQALSAALWRKNLFEVNARDLFNTEEYRALMERFSPDNVDWALQGLDNYRDTITALFECLESTTFFHPATAGIMQPDHDAHLDASLA